MWVFTMNIRGKSIGWVSETPQKPASIAAGKQKTHICSIYLWHKLTLGLWSPFVMHVLEKVAHEYGVGDIQERHGTRSGSWMRLSTTLELSCSWPRKVLVLESNRRLQGGDT